MTSDTADLASALLDRLDERGETVATAESLTGGQVCATLVDAPGASAVVQGAVVAYAPEVKSQILGVDRDQILANGTVDAGVAREMAEGVRLIDEIADGGVLREDGDAPLFLEVVRVHHPLVDLLIGPDRARLLEERIDERGLPVVDVGDDRDVADVVSKLLHARG